MILLKLAWQTAQTRAELMFVQRLAALAVCELDHSA